MSECRVHQLTALTCATLIHSASLYAPPIWWWKSNNRTVTLAFVKVMVLSRQTNSVVDVRLIVIRRRVRLCIVSSYSFHSQHHTVNILLTYLLTYLRYVSTTETEKQASTTRMFALYCLYLRGAAYACAAHSVGIKLK